MKKTAVILAGGAGTRAGGGVPKQFRTLGGEPMLFRPVTAFVRADSSTRIIIAVNPAYIAEWQEIISEFACKSGIKCEIVAGGASRRESVENALAIIADDGMVAVHDAARPLVSVDMIRRGWETCAGRHCAVPVVPVTDSLRCVCAEGTRSVDRSLYYAVQTPQVFPVGLLKRAYSQAGEGGNFTDDASFAEAAGESITLYDGTAENIKVTNPTDFAVAEAILNEKNSK